MTSLRDTTHQCEAIGCDRQISNRFLMCLEHWHLVPPDIARELNSALFAYERSKSGVFTRSKVNRYQKALKAAVDAVSAVTLTSTTRKDLS